MRVVSWSIFIVFLYIEVGPRHILWSSDTDPPPPPPPQIRWPPKCQFSVFCMIPSEKGSFFKWFLVCNLQKNPKKIPVFFLAPVIVFWCFQASEQAPEHQIKCVLDIERWIWLYDKQDKYLAKLPFFLGPSASSRVRLFSRCSQFL